MSGYVASARIVHVTPRLARAGGVSDGAAEPRSAPTAVIETLIVEADPSATGKPTPLVERFRAARERWSQLTFFLLDPDSWR